MPEITNFRNGAILNAHHGVESESGLKIRLEGLGTYGHPVEVNGVRAEMDGRHFPAETLRNPRDPSIGLAGKSVIIHVRFIHSFSVFL